eukprot:UN05829
MHPGNYIYYDAMQSKLGVCELTDIAVSVFTRVLSHNYANNSLLTDT